MTTTDGYEAALAKRVEAFKRQWGPDEEPDPGWLGGYQRGYADAASQPVTDEEVQAVLEHRWHAKTGRCACGEHFSTMAAFVRHTLEAARGVQRS